MSTTSGHSTDQELPEHRENPRILIEMAADDPDKGDQSPRQGGSGLGADAGALASDKEKRTSRSSSPTQLIRDLDLRVSSQRTRVEILKELNDQLVNDGGSFCEEEVDCLLSQIDSVFKDFSKHHSTLEVSWPAACLPHSYFSDGVFHQASMLQSRSRLVVAKLKSKFKATRATLEQSSASSTSTKQHPPTKLPQIQLPKFSGDYAAWPPFRDLFKSLVVDHPEASDINKLHHLKSCLSGEAAQLVASMPMVGESFSTAWDTLNKRYENKRLLIQAQLDKVFGNTTQIQGTASSINQLTTRINDAINMLHAIGQTTDNWDCVFVYHITQLLDRMTKEKWESSLGSNTDYPTYEQLMNFLHARARSLEWIETPSSRESKERGASKHSQQQRRSTAVAHSSTSAETSQSRESTTAEKQSSHSSDQKTYVCDYCVGKHFLTSCPGFQRLSPKEKLAHVHELNLCQNCFGRHYLRSCKNQHRCRRCNNNHHSALHEAFADTQSTTNNTQADNSKASTSTQSDQRKK